MVFNQASMEELNTSYAPRETVPSKKKKIHSNEILILLLYAMITLLLFSSVFYSRQVIGNIETKKESIVRLKESYQKILIENEKIQVMISELKDDHGEHQKLIKIIEGLYFENQAVQLRDSYAKKQNQQDNGSPLITVLIGLMLIGITRLIYLESRKKSVSLEKKRTGSKSRIPQIPSNLAPLLKD